MGDLTDPDVIICCGGKMNDPGGVAVDPGVLDINPTRILMEFDAITVFVCRERASGAPMLAYPIDHSEDRRTERFLCVPFPADTEVDFVEGRIDIRSVLLQPGYIFDIRYPEKNVKCWSVRVEDIPLDGIPKSGVKWTYG